MPKTAFQKWSKNLYSDTYPNRNNITSTPQCTSTIWSPLDVTWGLLKGSWGGAGTGTRIAAIYAQSPSRKNEIKVLDALRSTCQIQSSQMLAMKSHPQGSRYCAMMDRWSSKHAYGSDLDPKSVGLCLMVLRHYSKYFWSPGKSFSCFC